MSDNDYRKYGARWADLLVVSNAIISRVLRKWSKKEKYTVSCSSLAENAFLMSEVRRE